MKKMAENSRRRNLSEKKYERNNVSKKYHSNWRKAIAEMIMKWNMKEIKCMKRRKCIKSKYQEKKKIKHENDGKWNENIIYSNNERRKNRKWNEI